MLLPPVDLPLKCLSDAFGDTCSGCPIRTRFYVSRNPELTGWEDLLLIEIAKLANRKPAEAARPTALVCAAA